MTVSFFFKHYIKKFFYEKYIMLDYKRKRTLLLDYKNKFNLETFVETGTFLGDTVAILQKHFSMVYTIELQNDLARKCIERFQNIQHVKVLHGNSADVLSDIIPGLKSASLFWLDAHYSSEFYMGNNFIQTAKGPKETPILEELEIILKNGLGQNVILIDDARCFIGKYDYPSIGEMKKFLSGKGVGNNQISIRNDIIRIIPAAE